jgi:hypothetical protein
MLRIEQSKFYKMVEASYICMKQFEEGKWKYKEKRKMTCMKFLTANDEAQGGDENLKVRYLQQEFEFLLIIWYELLITGRQISVQSIYSLLQHVPKQFS